MVVIDLVAISGHQWGVNQSTKRLFIVLQHGNAGDQEAHECLETVVRVALYTDCILVYVSNTL